MGDGPSSFLEPAMLRQQSNGHHCQRPRRLYLRTPGAKNTPLGKAVFRMREVSVTYRSDGWLVGDRVTRRMVWAPTHAVDRVVADQLVRDRAGVDNMVPLQLLYALLDRPEVYGGKVIELHQ